MSAGASSARCGNSITASNARRTADGLWFPSEVDWHLEGREVIINRIVDYHETTSAVQKLK